MNISYSFKWHNMVIQDLRSWKTLKRWSFLHNLFILCCFSVICICKKKYLWQLFSFLPLIPLCKPFKLAVLELPGETGSEDTCCNEACGTLKVPWCFPFVNTCLRRLRVGRNIVLPALVPISLPGHGVLCWEEARELPACTRMGGTCCPVMAPRDLGMLVGETRRLQPFPFISFSSASGKDMNVQVVSCCEDMSMLSEKQPL